jgi:hypothetical protein
MGFVRVQRIVCVIDHLVGDSPQGDEEEQRTQGEETRESVVSMVIPRLDVVFVPVSSR